MCTSFLQVMFHCTAQAISYLEEWRMKNQRRKNLSFRSSRESVAD